MRTEPSGSETGDGDDAKFHRRVRQTAEQILGEEVSAIYQSIVLSCLDQLIVNQDEVTQNLADFEMDPGDIIENDEFGKPMNDNEWFYWNVVDPLELFKA